MILTVEKNPETIRRYSHIRPAPFWGSSRCHARCPANARTCTLGKAHTGPHVAHGKFRRVLAVWQGRGTGVMPAKRPTKAVQAKAPAKIRPPGLAAAMKTFRTRVLAKTPSLEEAFLLILAVSMVGFAIDWALRILGWR